MSNADTSVAVPLRAIPYATAWDLGPLDVAAAIVEPPDWDGRRFSTILHAHFFDSNGVPRSMISGESIGWANDVEQLVLAGASRVEQITAMPAAVFVWGQNLRGLLDEVNAVRTEAPPYGPGFAPVGLNIYPRLTPGELQLVTEGFLSGDRISLGPLDNARRDLAAEVRKAWQQDFEHAVAANSAAGAALPDRAFFDRKLTAAQDDKRTVQVLARRAWTKAPLLTQTELLKSAELQRYTKVYRDPKTLRSWISEVDPRPPESRRGRPRKNRSNL